MGVENLGPNFWPKITKKRAPHRRGWLGIISYLVQPLSIKDRYAKESGPAKVVLDQRKALKILSPYERIIQIYNDKPHLLLAGIPTSCWD